ncbi:MAG: dynamin family protein, partial [Verrucomicrobiales bacterium]
MSRKLGVDRWRESMESEVLEMGTAAHLAGKFDLLLEQGSTPFTVAVMGQMRSGKSTLLNALMGRDLAITGVNETTATVNCFKYSSRPEDCGRFTVVWKDAPEESVDINEIAAWIGDSGNATRTNRLVFYSESDFLKTANLVDTPGTRSTIEGHTSALSDFLHDESVRQGDKADAIIYVLLPVGRENDEKWLAEFEKSSRLPGATPFNSLAVVHKWEATLDVEAPAKAAAAKADKIRGMLGGQVSCVIAVSAPLAIVADRLQDDSLFWESMLRLGQESKKEAFELITLSEDYFLYDVEGCSLTPQARQELRDRATSVYRGLPWPSLKTIIRTAASPEILSPKDLLRKITEMSGFPTLRKELHDRYFARSRIIKAFGLLAKAWKPCQTAQTILRNLKAY